MSSSHPRGRHALAGGLLLALVLAFYIWTAATSADPALRGSTDPYNGLAKAFRHGHTYLPIKVPPGLLALRDPYDPGQNAPFQTDEIHDLTLYHGRLYSYWGPAPAVVLFLPYQLATGHFLSQGAAIVVLSFIGLLCSLGVLWIAARHWLPPAPAWTYYLIAATLALGNMAPWLLRRPRQYEVAIAGGLCFSELGLLLVVSSAIATRPARARLCLGFASLAMGLAFASRPQLGIGVLACFAAVPLLWRRLRQRDLASRLGTVGIVLAPFALCVLAVALYNQSRYGSLTDFGQSYQLANVRLDTGRFNHLRYVGPGLWNYLLTPVRWTVQFPFVQVPPPPGLPFSPPRGYDAVTEPTMGLFANQPFLLFLVLAPWALRRTPLPLRALVAGATAAALVLTALVSYVFWSTTNRYEADFATLLILAAGLSWLALVVKLERRRRRTAVLAAGAVLAVYGAIVMVGASMTGEKDLLRTTHPATFSALTRFFSPVSTALARIAGHPIISEIARSPKSGSEGYLDLGVNGGATDFGPKPTPIDIVSPGDRRAVLRARLVPAGVLPRGSRVTALVSNATVRGAPAAAVVDGGLARFPLLLRGGINHLTLTLEGPPALLAKYPAGASLARARGITVSER